MRDADYLRLLWRRALSNSEQAATGDPLMDKKENDTGRNALPSIRAVFGKNSWIPNRIRLNARGSQQFSR